MAKLVKTGTGQCYPLITTRSHDNQSPLPIRMVLTHASWQASRPHHSLKVPSPTLLPRGLRFRRMNVRGHIWVRVTAHTEQGPGTQSAACSCVSVSVIITYFRVSPGPSVTPTHTIHQTLTPEKELGFPSSLRCHQGIKSLMGDTEEAWPEPKGSQFSVCWWWNSTLC